MPGCYSIRKTACLLCTTIILAIMLLPAPAQVTDSKKSIVGIEPQQEVVPPRPQPAMRPERPEKKAPTVEEANPPATREADQTEKGESFSEWLDRLWHDASRMGVSRATFEAATRGLKLDYSLPDLKVPGKPDRKSPGQAEFVKPPVTYLSEPTFRRLTEQGRSKLRKHRDLLQTIEAKHGVSRYAIVSIWGRETAYGNYRLPHDTIRVLVTQGYVGRRKDQFRRELLIALSLLERQLVARQDLKSSWAGAMGPTQFMPSDYDKYAVDQDGDGQPNPWRSIPDALASAANQLKKNGWTPKRSWGFEVQLPDNFDCSLATPNVVKPISEWIKFGLKPLTVERSKNMKLSEPTSLLMPAGKYGPSFLTTDNFRAVKAYNLSELYALFVTHLADRLAGSGPYQVGWRKVNQLRERDVTFIQRHLARLGLYNDKIDGKAGSRTRAAVGAYQKANKLKQDCWPTMDLKRHMAAHSGGH